MAGFTDDISEMAYAYIIARAQKPVVSWTSSVLGCVGQVGQKAFTTLSDGLTSAAIRCVPDRVKDMTGTEQLLTVSVAGLVAWRSIEAGVPGKISELCQKVVPGVRWIRKKLGPMQIVFDPQLHNQKCMLESRRQGSDEVALTMPKSQCQIGVLRDGAFVVIGCAVRFDGNMLVAPDHVLGGDSSEVKMARGTQSIVSLKGKERIPLDTDLVAIKLTDQEMSTIGVTVCKLASVNDRGAFAQIVGPESKGTVGTIKPDPILFGRVVYAGTTVGGYSGAAYTVGPHIVGIHQMGGQVNGGYSASYVWSLIRMELNQRLESSEDWLLGQFKAGKKLRWKRTGDPDLVQICIDGQYTIVEQGSMAKAFGSEWTTSETIERATHKMAYGDYESTVFQETAGQSLGASEGSALDVEQKKQPLHDVISAYKALSSKQRQAFRKSSGLSIDQAKTTAGPIQTQ